MKQDHQNHTSPKNKPYNY